MTNAEEILQNIDTYELLQSESKKVKVINNQNIIVNANLTLLRWLKNIDKGQRSAKQKQSLTNDLNDLQKMCALCGELEGKNYSLQNKIIYLDCKLSVFLEVENGVLKESIYNLMEEIEILKTKIKQL